MSRNPIPYTGPSTPALINASNAAAIIEPALETSLAGTRIINAVERAFTDSRGNSTNTGISNCTGFIGGDYTVYGSTSAGATRFWGEVAFDNYCYIDGIEDVIINGTVEFDIDYLASYDSHYYFFFPADIALRNSATPSVYKYGLTLAGIIRMDESNSIYERLISMDCTARKSTGALPIYKTRYSITETMPNSFTAALEIGGTFSHPDYGAATVSTPASLNYTAWLLPDSGIFRVKGASNSAARVDFGLDPFTVEIDINGDGVFTDASDSIIW